METHSHACLNCGATLTGAYCQDCGQKADTHRITLSHLIKHDLVHGIWHFDKGLLFTLREALLRPGYMAMNYIKGKRIKYYNVFYLILIVLGINLLLSHLLQQHYNIVEKTETEGLVLHKDSADLSYYVKHYFKQLLFLMIPLFAFSGYISFRKLKLNYAEHAMIGANILLTGAAWYFFVMIGIYTSIDFSSTIFNTIVWGFAIFVLLSPVRVYFQAVRKDYNIGTFILRIVQWYTWFLLQLFIILLIIALFTGKKNFTLS